MEIYFVRHGQTNGNLAGRYQHINTSLNEIGVRQIEAIARKIAACRPTHIISSTQVRAVESARIILHQCGDLIPTNYAFFQEYRPPRKMLGQRYINFKSLAFMWSWFFAKQKREGEESYKDMILRIKEARQYLESLPKDSRVVVVSHRIFISFFLQHLCSDKPMNFFQAVKCLYNIYLMKNAEIVHLKFTRSEGIACSWQIVA